MLISDGGGRSRVYGPFVPPSPPPAPAPRPVYGPYVTHAPAPPPARCVIDDMRRQVDLLRQQAEAARRAAEQARQQAKDANLAAKAAEQAATQFNDPAHKQEAKRLRAKANSEDLLARKAEAHADLLEARQREQASRVRDAEEGRGADRPSQTTQAAQDDVKQKQFAESLLEPPPPGQPDPLAGASANTDTLLKRAQEAAGPVFDAYAHGKKPTQKQLSHLNETLGGWLEGASDEIRVAGVEAQARGEDPVAAMRKQADLIAGRMPKSGRFGNEHVREQLHDMLDGALKEIKGESPARRQLAAERYESDVKGRKQLGDATRFAAQADQGADKAQAYADSFGDQDSEAAASARQNAKYQREIADEAKDRVERLKHEQVIDTVDFNVKLKQMEVDDKATEYDLALQGDDVTKVLKLGEQLSHLQGQLATLKSGREQLAGGLELSDAKGVADTAKADWSRESTNQPRLIEIKQHAMGGKGGGVSPRTIEPEGYDRTFWAVPESKDAGNVSKGDDGKWYLDIDQGFGSHKKVELHPAAARMWDANERVKSASARAESANTAFGLDVEDLVGDPEKHVPGRLDPSRWEARAKEINDNLAKANQDVDSARLMLRMAGEHGASSETLDALSADLGMKLQVRRHAQDEAELLGLVQDWHTKDREFQLAQQPGSGHTTTLTQKDLDTLRGNLRAKIDWLDSSPVLGPGEMAALRKDRADFDALLKTAEQNVTAEFRKAQKSGNYGAYHKALDATEYARLQIREDDNRIKQAELGYRRTVAEETFGQMDTQGQPTMGEGGDYVYSPSKDHPAMGGDSRYLIAPLANTIEVMEGAVKQGDGSWIFQDKDGSEIKLSADKKTWTFPDSKQITERDGKFYVSFEESRGQVGESTATTCRTPEHELDPAAEQLWRINADQVAARAEGRAVQADMDKFRAMHIPPPPAKGADGETAPILSFDEDLDLRLGKVNTDIGELNTKLAALPPPGVVPGAEPLRTQLEAQLMLANAELRAVQAMQAWKAAEYNKLDVLGRRQAQRLDHTPGEAIDTDQLDQLQATAEKARSDWLQLRDRQIVAGKQHHVDDTRVLHEQWKIGHPGFSQAQEEDSDTWKTLQAAVADHKEAQRWQKDGSAITAADTATQDLVRSRLRPDQYNDNGELFKLFQEEPKVMAQGIINRHYLQYGDEPITMQGRTHLGNEVAFALGWPPSRQVNAPAAAANARLNEDLFRGMSQPQRDMQKAVVDQIIDLGGEHAKVTVLPVVYALDERSGIIQTSIFKVNCTDGGVKYVDEQGRSYKDLTDYRANNTLPGKGDLKMVMPEDGKFSLDDKGNVKLFVGDARTETGFETVRRVAHLDLIVGGVAVVAGVVLTFASAGTAVAGGATLILVGASMYGAATSAQSLQNQAAHGQSLSWSNEQARMDWINLGASLLAIPTLGAAGRAAKLGVEIKSATGATKTALQANARSLELFGKVMSVPTGAAGAYGMEEGLRNLSQNWRYMSTEEKWDQGASMLLNLVDMGTAPMLHRIAARRAAQGVSRHQVVTPDASSVPALDYPYRVGRFEKGRALVVDARGNEVAQLKRDTWRLDPEEMSAGMRFEDMQGVKLSGEDVDKLQRAGPLRPLGGSEPELPAARTVHVKLSDGDPPVVVRVSEDGIVFKAGKVGRELDAREIAAWMEGGLSRGGDTITAVLNSPAGMGIGKRPAKGMAVLNLPEEVRARLGRQIHTGKDSSRVGVTPYAVAFASGEQRRFGLVAPLPREMPSPSDAPPIDATPLGRYIPRRAGKGHGSAGSPRLWEAEHAFFEAAGQALHAYAREHGIRPHKIKGDIRVYVDRAICNSCLSVSAQFQREFPRIRVRVRSTDLDPLALPAALAARDSYGRSLLNPRGSQGLAEWTRASDTQVQEMTGHDPAELAGQGMGLRVYLPDAALAQKGFKPMVVFRGSEVGRAALPNWRDNILHGLGRQTRYDRIAADIGNHLSSGPDVLLVGHSLGGRLAAVAAHASGCDAITFNAAGVNRKVRNGLTEAQGHILSYRLGGDPLGLLQWLTPLPRAPGEARTLAGSWRGALTVNHLMGPVVDSMRRITPSGRHIDADLRRQTRLQAKDPLMRKLLRGLDRAGTEDSRAAAELIRSGELQVNVFKRDPLGVKRDGFYVDRADYIGITVQRAWLARPQRVAGIVTHEAVHYMNGGAADPHSLDLEVQAMRAQGAVDPWHWSNRVADDAALGERLAAGRAPGGDTVSSLSNPLGRRRVVRAVAAGVNLAALTSAVGLASSDVTTANFGVMSVAAVGSMVRAVLKTLRFTQASKWNRYHRLLNARLDAKARFELLAHDMGQAGWKQRPPVSGAARKDLRRGLREAVNEMRTLVPGDREPRSFYQRRVVASVDKLVHAVEALGTDAVVVQKMAGEMKALAKQKAGFDVILHRHIRFLDKMEKPSNAVPSEIRDEFEKDLAKIKRAEAKLRDGKPHNDIAAMQEMDEAVKGVTEIAEKLRPESAPIRKFIDGAYGVTYGITLGAFADKYLGSQIPGGSAGVVLLSMLAGSSVADLIRIGGLRFDEWMRNRGGPMDAPVGESAVFKKVLPAADDLMSALAGVGLAVLAFKSGLSPGTEDGIVRMLGTSAFAATSGYQAWEGLYKRRYEVPTAEQRPRYLHTKVLAGVGAGALLVTSLVAGLIADPKPVQVPPSQQPTVGQAPGLPSGHPTTRLRTLPPIERIVMADGDTVDTAGSLWAIARANLDWILTPQQQAALDGPVATEYKATQRLSQFNGFDPHLMDGKITNEPGDPDLLPDGWKVNVNTLGLTWPPGP